MVRTLRFCGSAAMAVGTIIASKTKMQSARKAMRANLSH
jgi:hypothetical protein